jgi:hypothetical protein
MLPAPTEATPRSRVSLEGPTPRVALEVPRGRLELVNLEADRSKTDRREGQPRAGICPGRTDRARPRAVSKPRLEKIAALEKPTVRLELPPRRQTRGFCLELVSPRDAACRGHTLEVASHSKGCPRLERLPVSPRNAHLAQADRAGPSVSNRLPVSKVARPPGQPRGRACLPRKPFDRPRSRHSKPSRIAGRSAPPLLPAVGS